MMTACVIGGAGFLGSHVADALSSKGYQVRIYDREVSPWIQSNQVMIVGDLLDNQKLKNAILGCEVVYNFAALSDLNEAMDKPLETARNNILGNILVMDACRLLGVRRFMYASTLYVYSREGGFYRCSKQSAELYVEEFQRVYGLNYTILRYGSLYGPRSNNSNGLYRIVRGAIETGEICYQGSPDSLREYIHVEDAAQASIAVLAEDFCNESVVLTGQQPMRVMDLLHTLAEILGNNVLVRFEEVNYAGHYIRTPYAYQPKLGRKYIPSVHVDLGQGLLQLIEEIQRSK